MAYTTEAKVENMFGIDITGGGSTALVDIIAAVKAWIDRYCKKTFEAVSETRYYDGNGLKCMIVDSFVGSPTVVILNSDGTTADTLTEGAAEGYLTGPYKGTEKYEIILTGYGGYSKFPCGTRRVKVTANFGASTAVPADIQMIATKLAGSIYQDNTEGIITSIRLGDYQATYASIDEKADALGVMNTLDQYRDIDI